MKILVKPIKNEENPLVEGYCDLGACKPVAGSCNLGICAPVATSEDQINFDDEILF